MASYRMNSTFLPFIILPAERFLGPHSGVAEDSRLALHEEHPRRLEPSLQLFQI
jgi:hypothetical protein